MASSAESPSFGTAVRARPRACGRSLLGVVWCGRCWFRSVGAEGESGRSPTATLTFVDARQTESARGEYATRSAHRGLTPSRGGSCSIRTFRDSAQRAVSAGDHYPDEPVEHHGRSVPITRPERGLRVLSLSEIGRQWKGDGWVDWSAIGTMSSTIVAVAALFFSVLAFRSQQRWAERNAWANVRPFFWTKLQTYEDLKSIILRNDGVGPAVITRATFSRGEKSTSRIVDLFDLDIPYWETFTSVSPGRVVPPEGEVVLLKQSLQHLRGQGIDEAVGLARLAEWQAQRSGIHISIEFEDLYGNPMKKYERTI